MLESSFFIPCKIYMLIYKSTLERKESILSLNCFKNKKQKQKQKTKNKKTKQNKTVKVYRDRVVLITSY